MREKQKQSKTMRGKQRKCSLDSGPLVEKRRTACSNEREEKKSVWTNKGEAKKSVWTNEGETVQNNEEEANTVIVWTNEGEAKKSLQQ